MSSQERMVNFLRNRATTKRAARIPVLTFGPPRFTTCPKCLSELRRVEVGDIIITTAHCQSCKYDVGHQPVELVEKQEGEKECA